MYKPVTHCHEESAGIFVTSGNYFCSFHGMLLLGYDLNVGKVAPVGLEIIMLFALEDYSVTHTLLVCHFVKECFSLSRFTNEDWVHILGKSQELVAFVVLEIMINLYCTCKCCPVLDERVSF